MGDDDWRVEVELGDEAHGHSLGERLRSLTLDDDARKRLGERAIVTRSGSTLFVYTRTGEGAAEAVRVIRELVGADELTAELRTTRWHPIEEAWEDTSVPLPRTEAERERERERHEEREREAIAAGGEYDWRVHVRAPDRAEADALEQQLGGEGLSVDRRWRYLTIGALTEEQANELAARIRAELPGAEIEVQPTLDLPSPAFVLIRSWL